MVTVKFLGKHDAPVWYKTQGRTKYAFSKKNPLCEVSQKDAERLIKNYPGTFEVSKGSAAKEQPNKPAEAKKTVKKDGDK